MKILIIDIYYSAFLADFYQKYPEFLKQEYQTQLQALYAEKFGTSDFYSSNLNHLGCQTVDVIINTEILQKQWAKEQGIRYFKGLFKNTPKLRRIFKSNWETKILESQIMEFRPDVLYCQGLSNPDVQFLKRIKKQAGIKLIVGQVACPTVFDKKKLAAFDLILTSFPHYVQRFRDIGLVSEYFRIGFEATLLQKLTKTEQMHGAVFIGGISRHHAAILETFEYLAKNTNIDFWGYGSKHLPPDSYMRARHHGEAWGLEMYNILYNSKISINRHIDAAENYANNMRLYESTGVGTMLITDAKDNLGELFEIGKEVETYRTKEELLEKINYYLTHEEERQKIALAGQQRTLHEHTYAQRMKELTAILEKYVA